jgi:hypothetical protein
MKSAVLFILNATPSPRFGRYMVHSANRHDLPNEIKELIDRAADTVCRCLRQRP